MSIAIITGSGGLIGAESVKFFSKKFVKIIGIDNDLRKYFFGKSASVKANINSRFQTLVLGAEVMNLGKQKREKVMLGLLKYGKSESEWSSAHYKAQ